MARIRSGGTRESVLVAPRRGGGLVGFLEVALRSHAEGCASHPVTYIEGWYVETDLRRCGVGRRLVEAAERWAIQRGCVEIASDALLDNRLGQLAHRKLGFTETERLVHYRRALRPRPRRRTADRRRRKALPSTAVSSPSGPLQDR